MFSQACVIPSVPGEGESAEGGLHPGRGSVREGGLHPGGPPVGGGAGVVCIQLTLA